MANHQILDRVEENTTSTGTGALVLGGATTQMRSFSGAGFSNGDTFLGLIKQSNNGIAEWELSICTYSTSGGGSITRSTVRYGSSGAGVAVDFSPGTKTISVVEMGSPHANRYREQTAAGPATMTIEDYELGVNQTVAAAITVYLYASPVRGMRQRVSDVKRDSSTNNITINGNGHNIGAASTHVLAADAGSIEFRFNGTEWNPIAFYA